MSGVMALGCGEASARIKSSTSADVVQPGDKLLVKQYPREATMLPRNVTGFFKGKMPRKCSILWQTFRGRLLFKVTCLP